MAGKAFLKGYLTGNKIIFVPVEETTFNEAEFIVSTTGDIVIISGDEQEVEKVIDMLSVLCENNEDLLEEQAKKVAKMMSILKESVLDNILKTRKVEKPKTSIRRIDSETNL